MKTKKSRIRDLCACLLLIASAVMLSFSYAGPRKASSTENIAQRVGKKVSERLQILEKFSDKALDGNVHEWMDADKLPEDMAVYRYVNDSLQSWYGQFYAGDDELNSEAKLPRVSNQELSSGPSLSLIADTLTFFNSGPRWYLAKRKTRGDTSVICGLCIIDPAASNRFNGINPKLKLSDRYTVKPLSSGAGTPVPVDGKALFNIQLDSKTVPQSSNHTLLWISFVCFFTAVLIFVHNTHSILRMVLALCGMLMAGALTFFWGGVEQNNFLLFSPSVYADGNFFYSLGAIVIINLVLTLLCVIIFFSREAIYRRIRTERALKYVKTLSFAAFILAVVFALFEIRSVVLNSGIGLELFRFNELSQYSLITYCSFLVLFTAIPLLLEFSNEALRRFGKEAIDIRKDRFKLPYAASISLALILISAFFGFSRECNKLEAVADRLSMDRDILLEIQLKSAEEEIASDPVIASLTTVRNSVGSIEKRITENWFPRMAGAYRFEVKVNPSDISCLKDGEPVSENSRFFYLQQSGYYPKYGAVFLYNIPGHGVKSILLTAEPVADRHDRGYAELFDLMPPGRIAIPSGYSYARYEGRDLTAFKGDYPYETKLDESLNKRVYARKKTCFREEGQMHFVFTIAEEKAVVISRPSQKGITYMIEWIFFSILLYAMVSAYSLKWSESGRFRRNYYRTRISWVLMFSLLLALVTMAFASVLFVYNRNDSNMQKVLSEKISGTQSLLTNRTRGASCTEDLNVPEMVGLLERVAQSSKLDISLFTPEGKVFLSTRPFLFRRLSLSNRIDGEAYRSIILDGRRFHIDKKKTGGKTYYNMYAPLIGENGKTLAIICSPYTDETYDFEKDAASHFATILTVFLLLLLLSRFTVQWFVDRMFNPLIDMSERMSRAGLDSLKPIEYNYQDEISSIIEAYNRMVEKLSESSRELAQAERDKAWSGMARQVAHEIKNPLTPMKLQLQRLIRLKARNAEGWQDKFDEVAKVLLDHIDILTDTANEFSTFAKLYTEEHTLINLNTVICEEIAMFDNRAGIKFDYLGFNDAVVSGPKPQLTRVFVNLLNNSVQALEGRTDGHIVVSLRNSTREGYYDIVFEDNGPGVSAENTSRLFTPNFTTKNAGSGLGLAISRSILERCGAEISYSTSFTLGGACFTIHYPKP